MITDDDDRVPEPTRHVRLKLNHYGSSAKDGHSVYKFAKEIRLQEILEKRQWQWVRESKPYIDMRCPPTEARDKDLHIDILLPAMEDVWELATRWNEQSQPQCAQVGEWVARYFPSGDYSTREVNAFTGDIGPEKVTEEGMSASFEIGVSRLWSAWVYWDSDGRISSQGEDKENIAEEPHAQATLFPSGQIPDIEEDAYLEGTTHRIESNRYERDRKARRKCIEHHGTRCIVCRIDFGERYGPEAQGFIHVHHLVPMATIAREDEVDPREDMVPVCPNCHAVMHMREKPYTPEDVKRMLERTDRS